MKFIFLSLKDKSVLNEMLNSVDTKFQKALSENVFEVLTQSPALNFALNYLHQKRWHLFARFYFTMKYYYTFKQYHLIYRNKLFC